MQTPWTVQVVTPNDSTEYDAFGNPIPSAPTSVDVPVYGWAPAGTFETTSGNIQTQVTHDLDLYAPAIPATPLSTVVVDGIEYEVEGRVEDYNHGPFGYTPGVRARLKRTTG